MVFSISESRISESPFAEAGGATKKNAKITAARKPIVRAENMVKLLSLRFSLLPSWHLCWRQYAGLLVLVVILGGCEATQNLSIDTMLKKSRYYGGAVADEPHAALVARDVLAAGGSAADAAVALYFTLAVTYPSTASLGSGGVCLVYHPDEDYENADKVIEFYANTAPSSVAPPRRPNAVPGAVRGMYALHARYGRLKWSQLLAPAEGYARLGHQISRALARDLQLAGAALFDDPEMRKIFLQKNGKIFEESQRVYQLELGAVLSQLRIKGAGEFYTGSVARALSARANEAQGALSIENLRAFRPVWRDSLSIPFGHNFLHTAPPPAGGGITAAAIFHLLAEDDRYLDAPVAERAHLMAEASKRAFADRQMWMESGNVAPLDTTRLKASMATYAPSAATAANALTPQPQRRLENPASTSFVTLDRNGLTVSCGVTMNNLFGTGRIVPGTGILLAASPASASNGALSLAPIALVNHNTNQVFFAAGSVGGAAAPSALAGVMRATLLEKEPLRQAIGAPRLHHGGAPDSVLTELDFPDDGQLNLQQRGHQMIDCLF